MARKVTVSKFSWVFWSCDSLFRSPFPRLAPLICITIKFGMYMWQLRGTMSMPPPVKAVCKSTFYHLWNISRIRKLLSTKTAEILVHVFVTSKLDHFNSLLYSVPKCVIKKLQSVQKVAALLSTSSRRLDRITPILFDLHWLPGSEIQNNSAHPQSSSPGVS